MYNPDQLWQQVLTDLQITVNAPIFKAFASQTVCLDVTEDTVVVGCPNPVSLNHLDTKFRPQIEQTIQQITKQSFQVQFVIHKTKAEKTKAAPLFDELPETTDTISPIQPINQASNTTVTPSNHQNTPSLSQPSPQSTPLNNLNPSYTFDQFVVGNTNRVAHAAALAVTDNPGKNYNPFFLYGGTGVGKTHLVQAIGNALIAKNPKTHVIYCSIERFMNDFIDSIRFKTTNEFKTKYRSADVLIVDDIQFLAGDKQSTQEEFFHTFNELHASGRQVILCSDRPPKKIETLTDRLISRFEGGLSVDMALPDFETRSAIIQAKASHLNIYLTSQIVEYLAGLDNESIRAIEGMMLKLQTVAIASAEPLTLAIVQSIFGQPTPAAVTPTPMPRNPNALLKLICESYGITLKELISKKRTQNLVTPRQLAMYMLRQDLGLNLETIGQLLGGRDHTTIMHGIDKVAKTLNTDDQLKASLTALRQGSL